MITMRQEPHPGMLGMCACGLHNSADHHAFISTSTENLHGYPQICIGSPPGVIHNFHCYLELIPQHVWDSLLVTETNIVFFSSKDKWIISHLRSLWKYIKSCLLPQHCYTCKYNYLYIKLFAYGKCRAYIILWIFFSRQGKLEDNYGWMMPPAECFIWWQASWQSSSATKNQQSMKL